MNYKKYKKSDLITMLNIKDKTIAFLKEQSVDKEIKDVVGSANIQLYTTREFSKTWYKSIIERTVPLYASTDMTESCTYLHRVFKKDGNIVLIRIDCHSKTPVEVTFFKRAK